MLKILLIGTPLSINIESTVGSGGGYARNMYVYLKYFQSEKIKITPCFHTTRKEYGINAISKVIRLGIDLKRILSAIVNENPSGIHIMAQYRKAIIREFMYILIAKIFKKPILYEIKAGAFIDAYTNGSKIYKHLVKYIILNSDIVLVEGKKYVKFLMENFDTVSYHFPNVVPDSEIPNIKKNILESYTIKILYVGYCYNDKGVFHLVDAFQSLIKEKYPVELNIIGEEHPDFKNYLSKIINKEECTKINRFGGMKHDFILDKMQECDIFCYPTFHSGEGHSNSINEAMMNSMVIISTTNGFLGEILNDKSAYFIEERSTQSIYNAILEILSDRKTASDKAKEGYKILKDEYVVSKIRNTISKYYFKLVKYN